MNPLLILPVLIPLTGAAVSLLGWRSVRFQRGVALISSVALLAAAVALLLRVWEVGILCVQMGGWPAPFGITFVADLLSGIMVVLAGMMGVAVVVSSVGGVDPGREAFGYYPLLQTLLMGVCGAFLTGDIFNLYVWFEVMLMSSFVLLALGGERGQMEGAIKYVTLNLMSSALFLAGIGILYGVAGTLNMADLAQKLAGTEDPGLVTTIGLLLLIAFGIKAAVFPLFFWLPASYHTPPPAVSAIFAGLLTKVGVYALLRMFSLVFVQEPEFTHRLILVVAALTMVTGVLGAVAQDEFRRILSFHIVSQIGYMVMGLGLFTAAGLTGSIFYLIHHIVVKTNLFLVSGLTQSAFGTGELKKLGGLYRSSPFVAILFLIPALSLAGLPPLSGFYAKFILVRAGLESGEHAVVAVALGVSLLTLFSMSKIWTEAFWKPRPGDEPHTAEGPRFRLGALVPIGVLAAATVAIGGAAGPVYELAARASAQLMDPTAYLDAVLGAHG